jgi:uncharacterized Fe-S center protein
MVNKAPVAPDSVLAEKANPELDHFTRLFPESNWKIQLDHAEMLGMGSQNYELITV